MTQRDLLFWRTWMRSGLPTLNDAIDDPHTINSRSELNNLVETGLELAADVKDEIAVKPTPESGKFGQCTELFTYLTMIHSSLRYHENTKGRAIADYLTSRDADIQKIEESIRDLRDLLALAPRFLATTYLMHNPPIEGKRACFRSLKGEQVFINGNRMGTLNFENAATHLIAAIQASDEAKVVREVEAACKEFRWIAYGNSTLLHQLKRDEFLMFEGYYGTVKHSDTTTIKNQWYRGVNAGDQPWSYIIDTILDINLKLIFAVAFDENSPTRPIEVLLESNEPNRSVDWLLELRNIESYEGYLRKDYFQAADTKRLFAHLSALKDGRYAPLSIDESCSDDYLRCIVDALAMYCAASSTHFALATYFIPPSKNGGIKGTSGMQVEKFLGGLLDARRQKLWKAQSILLSRYRINAGKAAESLTHN